MEGLLLLCGHLIGDYIVQNDWMAKNKTNRLALSRKQYHCDVLGHGLGIVEIERIKSQGEDEMYRDDLADERRGHLACTIHCLCYTLAVWLCSFWWMPWWGLVACFALHWPIDRFRLARWWMLNVSRQKEFATGPLAPWSIIVVDNIFHIVTLAAIGAIAIL